jgi:hypothetical protein
MLQAFPFHLTWKAKDAAREGLDAFNIGSARGGCRAPLCSTTWTALFLNYGVAIGLARLKRLPSEAVPQISDDPQAKGNPHWHELGLWEV